MPQLSDIHHTIDERQQELVELASHLIGFETVSPPGRNTESVQSFVADYLRELGFQVDQFDVYPGDPNVVGVLNGSARDQASSILINGHIDVAEVGDPELWSYTPFETTVVDDRLYGRGAADMKGPMAAALFSLRVLRDLDVSLRGDVIFESVIGEEQGERGTRACIERGYRADFAIVPEPTSLVIAGQGGVVTGWIEIQSPETLHDGVRSRMIHAGGGLIGANAIEKMTKVITALQELERHWAVTKRYPGFSPGTTTINPAVIEGGRHPAFIADHCALWITVHFYPDETWQEVAAEIEDHILRMAASDVWLRDHPPTFRWGGESMIEDRGEIFPAVALDAAHPGVQCLVGAHRFVRGHTPELAMWPSVSDAGWLTEAGIPTVIYGPGNLEQAHTVDEWVCVADLVAAAQVYAACIVGWCNHAKARADQISRD